MLIAVNFTRLSISSQVSNILCKHSRISQSAKFGNSHKALKTVQKYALSRWWSSCTLNSHVSTPLACYQSARHSIYFRNGLVAKSHLSSLIASYQPRIKPICPLLVPARTVVKFSKLGKRKTVKAVAKRFYRTGSGKLKYWPAGKVHNMLAKSKRRGRKLRKARYVSKTQLKTLNKMISGW